MKKQIILASQSPRRKQFLDQLGLDYKVLPSNIDEDLPEFVEAKTSAERIAMELARQKAFAVAEQISNSDEKFANQMVIIAADTIVVLDKKLYGKPNNIAEAKAILQSLCGKTHQVYTGIAVAICDLATAKTHCLMESERTLVSFRNYEESEIDAYINTGEPMDKAGAYALQGIGSCLVEKIDGCYSNVVGLPVPKLIKMLRQSGISVLGQ